MKRTIDEITLIKKMKNVTRKIYYLMIDRQGSLKINQKNYFDIYVKCDELFQSIFTLIDECQVNKSLFLDFMNFQLQVNYCFEIITNKEMTTKEIITLINQEKGYLDYTFQCVQNIDLSKL